MYPLNELFIIYLRNNCFSSRFLFCFCFKLNKIYIYVLNKLKYNFRQINLFILKVNFYLTIVTYQNFIYFINFNPKYYYSKLYSGFVNTF